MAMAGARMAERAAGGPPSTPVARVETLGCGAIEPSSWVEADQVPSQGARPAHKAASNDAGDVGGRHRGTGLRLPFVALHGAENFSPGRRDGAAADLVAVLGLQRPPLK